MKNTGINTLVDKFYSDQQILNKEIMSQCEQAFASGVNWQLNKTMKTKFKVYVNGRSKEIQEHLFKLGYKLRSGDNEVKETNYPFLYVDSAITYGWAMGEFMSHGLPELTVDEVLALKPEYNFKPFDKVLARDNDSEEWRIEYFSHYKTASECPFACLVSYYAECIPYEGNEHLSGTK